MRHRVILRASLTALLLAGCALAGDGPKSGPQVGDELVPFNPLNLNGPAANEKACPV